MGIEELVEKLKREDPEFRAEYEKADPVLDTANNVFAARLAAGISQEELARRVGTHQSSIARAESGTAAPSISFLRRIAEALGTKLVAPNFQINVEQSQQEVYTQDTEPSPLSVGDVIEGVHIEYFSPNTATKQYDN